MLLLPTTSLYTRSPPLSHDQLSESRDEDGDVARSNQQAIRQKGTCGESVIRKVSTLNDSLLSVEHDISIYVRERKNGSRFAIVLLDNGLNSNRPDGPPCFGRRDPHIKNRTVNEFSMNPILIPMPDTVHTGVDHPRVPEHDREHANRSNSFSHVVSLLPFYFGMSLSPQIIASTPRPDIAVLLKELFKLVVSAECQFLNCVRGVVNIFA